MGTTTTAAPQGMAIEQFPVREHPVLVEIGAPSEANFFLY